MEQSNSTCPIDAVITWVDGQDPKHLAKLNEYLSSIGGKRPKTADPTRFHDDGEITFCLLSILKFAPWIRTIHIVTDDQTPEIFYKLKETEWGYKIRIVDHKVIYRGFEYLLPVFNIRSIMTMLWRIPDLADNFLFFNDDFALIKPVNPEDFFRNNRVVIRGEWRPMEDTRLITRLRKQWRRLFPQTEKQKLQDRAKHTAAQKNSAKIAGFSDKYFWLRHEPHPWRVATTRDFFSEHPDLFASNMQPKLRAPDQFICESLAAYLEIANNNAIFESPLKAFKIDPPDQTEASLRTMIARADNDADYAFVCIQSLEKAPPHLREFIVTWLKHRITPGIPQELINLIK